MGKQWRQWLTLFFWGSRITADGLMFQEELPYDEGMLFVFDDSKKRSFWMSNMQFSLDIIWIDSQVNIVHIEKNVPPCNNTEPKTCPRNF